MRNDALLRRRDEGLKLSRAKKVKGYFVVGRRNEEFLGKTLHISGLGCVFAMSEGTVRSFRVSGGRACLNSC